MRSIFAWLKDAPREEVVAWLDAWAQYEKHPDTWRERWLYPDQGDPVLYIELYNLLEEFEPSDVERLIATLGNVPSVQIVADVSGRHDGTPEVRSFVLDLLHRFKGLVGDDYSTHFWTVKEVERNRSPTALKFFDYRENSPTGT